MDAHFRFTLMMLVAVAGSAMAQPNASAPAPAVQGFVEGIASIRTANGEIPDHPAPATSSCTGSTFTELGHGHGEATRARYATVHCPNYDRRAATGDRGDS